MKRYIEFSKSVFLLSAFFFLPIFVNAQVLINEISWMGTENSANDEWIEIKNTSSSTVDISSWVLEAQDGSPKIILDGSINPSGYFLLERSDDSSVPNILADQIYTGALSNSGEILILRDVNGFEIDRVDGSNSWENVGGDNTTKNTAQKNGEKWITGTSTPKSKNITVSNLEENIALVEDGDATEPVMLDNQAPRNRNKIKADAGENIIAQVGQNIFFDGSLSRGENLSFSWNMGDGNIKTGKDFLYKYSFPGRYIVTLFVTDGWQKSQNQIEIVIYPEGIYISEFYSSPSGGWLEIQNSSDNFIDLSLYSITNKVSVFLIPEGTFLAANSYLVFSEDVLGMDFVKKEGELVLAYPNGQAVDRVKYKLKNTEFSATRKNEEEFILTKNKSPGFKNVSVSYNNEVTNVDEVKINLNKGVSESLIKENQAYFVKAGGKKSFLAIPAYAQVISTTEKDSLEKDDAVNLSASVVSFGYFKPFFFGLVFGLLFFMGFLFIRRYK